MRKERGGQLGERKMEKREFPLSPSSSPSLFVGSTNQIGALLCKSNHEYSNVAERRRARDGEKRGKRGGKEGKGRELNQVRPWIG